MPEIVPPVLLALECVRDQIDALELNGVEHDPSFRKGFLLARRMAHDLASVAISRNKTQREAEAVSPTTDRPAVAKRIARFFFERAARLRPDGATRILVVDDVPQNVELLTARLEDENYVVSKAYDGFQALGKTKSEKPDLIVLDVMMPRIDGFETCRRIKADPASAHIPVILVTALSDVASRVRGFEAGADDYLTCPINFIALMARIRSLLQQKR
jgi:CheY-like chemotaxis protein